MTKIPLDLTYTNGNKHCSISQACKVLLKLEVEHPTTMQQVSIPSSDSDATSALKEKATSSESLTQTTDYSDLFGEEFRVVNDDHWDFKYLQLLDIKAVEEGILHVLFACASQVSYFIFF